MTMPEMVYKTVEIPVGDELVVGGLVDAAPGGVMPTACHAEIQIRRGDDTLVRDLNAEEEVDVTETEEGWVVRGRVAGAVIAEWPREKLNCDIRITTDADGPVTVERDTICLTWSGVQ